MQGALVQDKGYKSHQAMSLVQLVGIVYDPDDLVRVETTSNGIHIRSYFVGQSNLSGIKSAELHAQEYSCT